MHVKSCVVHAVAIIVAGPAKMPVSIHPDSQVEMGEVGDTEGNKRDIEYQNAKAYLLTQSVKSGLNL